MKRKLIIVSMATLAFVACLAIVGCGSSNQAKKEISIPGTWILRSATIDGVDYTKDQLKQMSDSTKNTNAAKTAKQLLNWSLIFNEDGRVWTTINGETTLASDKWSKSGDTIKLGDKDLFKIDSDTIIMSEDKNKFVFERSSDTATATETKAQTGTDKNSSASSSTKSSTSSSSSSVDWKEFLQEYEKFVDDYVALYQEYKDNPTDMNLLSKYSQLASQAAEFASKANNVKSDLSSEEAVEYAQELLRIQNKLLDVLK